MKNIIFMGTPDFSVPVLKGLIENYNVIGVVTQPDKPVGRKGELQKSPVKIVAEENNIKVFQPIKIRKEFEEILAMNPDIIVTCAYGQIIPKEILDYPKYGCINVHASLLPKYRGGAPIHRAIMSGEKETGITIMYMDVGMDSGDIITQEKVKIGNDTTVGELHDELSILGRDLLLKTLPSIFEGTNNRTVQNQDEVTFGYIIKREDELVNFDDTSNNVHNKIRGLSPYPCAYGLLDNKVVKLYKSELGSTKSSEKPGTIIKIYDDGIGVKTSDGEVIIKELQFEGKKKMLVSNYLNGIDKNKLIGKMFSIE